MKNKKNISLLIIIILLISIKGYSQISSGGTPHSFSNPTVKDSVEFVKMSAVNVDSLLQADSSNDNSFRFGYAIDVNMGLNNNGTWDTLQNGDKIWRLKILSKNAFSINLIFDDFWLPNGADFFVYSEDGCMILGAFTSDLSNNQYNKFSTDLIKGDIVVLEYYEPSYATGGIINVDKVIHGYKNLFDDHGNGNSQSCNIDVNCSQGNNWCIQKRAVSLILVNDNQELCSGCLLNNVREDLKPYYLTAFHCADSDKNGTLSQSEISNAQTWIFRFKYWSPTCNQGDGAKQWRSISGSSFKAGYDPTDMLLLQLNSPPPSGFGVLYAGWDNTSTIAQSGSYIHHPAGDIMKISLFSEPLQKAIQPVGNTISWQVKLSEGVVEGGSSGAPLFNQYGLVIGQHKGRDPYNALTCNNLNAFAYAGRFNVSWNNGLSAFLDPDNTGTTSVDATSPTIYLINRTLTGTHKFAALEDIHIEGNVSGLLCHPNNTPFTAEPGSNVEVKAKNITIKQGTHFKAGSNVTITATDNINCSDNIVEGYYINVFCNVDINKKKTTTYASNDDISDIKKEKESIFNVSEHIKIYPNPTTGIFEIAFSDNYKKYSEILIYNATGKIVYKQNNITQNIIPIDICHLQSGVYIIQIIQDQNAYTQKIILH